MPERLRAIWQRILDWWNQFTARQKTLIIGASTVVLLTIIILVSVLNQPQYVLLATAQSTKEASEIRDLLDSDSDHESQLPSISFYPLLRQVPIHH